MVGSVWWEVYGGKCMRGGKCMHVGSVGNCMDVGKCMDAGKCMDGGKCMKQRWGISVQRECSLTLGFVVVVCDGWNVAVTRGWC